MMHRVLRTVLAVLALAALLVFVACGDDDDSGDGGASTGAQSSVTSDVAQEVEQLEQRPTDIALDEPFEGEIPKGKTIDYLQCGVPLCVTLGERLSEGAAALGWKVNVIDQGLTPEEVKAAWGKVVRDEPDAVITTGGFPREIYKAELKQVADKGIPVVAHSDGAPAGGGVTATISGQDRAEMAGKRMAQWVAADSGGDANTLFVTSSGFITLTFALDAFKAEYAKSCPDCELEVYDAPLTSIGKDLANKVAQQLQRNPDVDYLVLGYNDMALGLPAALSGAGVGDQVKVVTQGQTPPTSALTQEGDIDATYVLPGPETMWRSLDILLRIFDGSHDESQTLRYPEWFVTPGEVPSTTEDYPAVEDYQEQFKRIWGL